MRKKKTHYPRVGGKRAFPAAYGRGVSWDDERTACGLIIAWQNGRVAWTRSPHIVTCARCRRFAEAFSTVEDVREALP